MAKRLAILLGSMALMVMTAAAQNLKQHTPTDPSDSAKKLVTISGLVGPDGKTFVASAGKIVWTVIDPEALLDDVGQQVRIRARIDATKHEIQVTSVRIDPTVGARMNDAAFRR
jgi:hypothetical protein